MTCDTCKEKVPQTELVKGKWLCESCFEEMV